MSDRNKRAFIIMPFSEDNKLLYENFLKIVLEEEGFISEVAYASQNSRSILQDIVSSLYKCDLVIADLTDSNPNVFYELGIAHTFEKDTILLTQNINDLPFDLFAYRVIEYNTHFVKIKKPWDEFREFVRGAISGETLFGNPVIDYKRFVEKVPEETKVEKTKNKIVPQKSDKKESKGLIDHMINWEKGMEKITNIILNITKATNDIGDKTREMTDKSDALTNSNMKNNVKLMMAKNLMMNFSEELTLFNEIVSKNNSDYALINNDIENSLEFIVEYQDFSDNRKQAEEYLSKIIHYEDSVSNGISAMKELRNAMLKIHD